MRLATLGLVLAAGILSACADADRKALEAVPAFRVADVEVQVAPNAGAAGNPAAHVREHALAIAQQQNARAPAGVPDRTVVVSVDRVHYKNAGMSLLVGSGNSMHGSVRTRDRAGRATAATAVGHADVGSHMVNGIVGAVIAATSDRVAVDAKMAPAFARKAMARAYALHGGRAVHPDGSATHDREYAPSSAHAVAYKRVATPAARPKGTYTRVQDAHGMPVSR